jgi:4-carboxymuconolactone decarboxylase
MTMIPETQMTAAQREACTEAVQGPRGKVPGPMVAWLRSPQLARRAQKLGEMLRFDSSLDPILRELAILTCARHWNSHYEWTAHKRIALVEGLSPQVIDAIAAGRRPETTPSQDLVFRLSRTILTEGKLPAALYGEGLDGLGETALVELVAILGYYSLVALTLNVFELGLPEANAPELDQTDAAPPPRSCN